MKTKAQVRKLWKICFEDSDLFIDLYFSQRYRNDINYVVRSNENVIAALQAIPYNLTFLGNMVPVGYISGACTDPQYRKKGYMRELLKATHVDLYKQHKGFSTLIPANDHLWGYYAEAGYITAFYQQVDEIIVGNEYADNIPTSDYRIEILESLSDSACDFIEEQFAKRVCCIQHDVQDLSVIMADWQLGEGKVLACYHQDCLVGIAFWIVKEQIGYIRELLFTEESVKDYLLQEIPLHMQSEKLLYIHPSKTNQIRKGMARVIDVEKMLSIYAMHNQNLFLYINLISDPDIPENEGHYLIRNGHCVRVFSPQYQYIPFSISQITDLLLNDQHPFMSLMME